MNELNLSGLIYKDDKGECCLNIHHTIKNRNVDVIGDYIINGPTLILKLIYFYDKNGIQLSNPKRYSFSVKSEKFDTKIMDFSFNDDRKLKINLTNEFNGSNKYELIIEELENNKYLLKIINKKDYGFIFTKTIENGYFIGRIKSMCEESIIKKEINNIKEW